MISPKFPKSASQWQKSTESFGINRDSKSAFRIADRRPDFNDIYDPFPDSPSMSSPDPSTFKVFNRSTEMSSTLHPAP